MRPNRHDYFSYCYFICGPNNLCNIGSWNVLVLGRGPKNPLIWSLDVAQRNPRNLLGLGIGRKRIYWSLDMAHGIHWYLEVAQRRYCPWTWPKESIGPWTWPKESIDSWKWPKEYIGPWKCPKKWPLEEAQGSYWSLDMARWIYSYLDMAQKSIGSWMWSHRWYASLMWPVCCRFNHSCKLINDRECCSMFVFWGTRMYKVHFRRNT